MLAGVFVATAAALRFDDASCKDGDPCRPTEGVVGASYGHKLTGEGGNGPPYTYLVNAGSLPPGLSLNPDSGLISGKPTQAGTYKFEAGLQDNPKPPPDWCVTRGSCASQPFTINVVSGISINNQTAKPGTIGQAYSEPLTATNLTSLNPPTGTPATGATWSVNSGTLPPGVVLGADGVLSGTPTAEGSYQFVVRAELDPQRWDTETLTIAVRTAVAITAPPVPKSEIGVPFTTKLIAAGGNGAYTWTLAGALPSGLALAADGTISGTPRAAGTFRFTATATDGETRTASYAGVLNVAQRLAISTLRLRPGKVGRLYRAKLATTGGVLPKKWKVTSGPLPRGIRLDRALGVLSGTPTRPGRYRVTFEARDALKVTSTKTFVINVLA